MSNHEYGRAFEIWRDAAHADWESYTHHDFVEQMANGTLPEAQFVHYLRQDYVFLIHFARAWALAAAKAGTLGEMAAASATVHALVHVEMPLHIETCAKQGIDKAALEATTELPANLAYTRYVLEAGYSGDFLDLMAALAPCVLGYGTVGARLANADGPYAAWFQVYGGEEFQTLCRDVGALIDGALVRRLGDGWANLPRAAELAHQFRIATRLEQGFWNMALTPPPNEP